MHRSLRLAVGLILIASMSGRDARAQWGYGGWGWGGWGGGVATPASAALQGAGYYAMGAGVYNLDTAKARSINAQTASQWNDYVAQVTIESARIHAARTNHEMAKNQKLYDARQQQLRDNPGRREIENGDALNLAVQDLSDPRLGSSALRAAKAPVPASLIAQVPFIYASERVTLMLDDQRASVKWPEVFEGERFAGDKKAFDDLVARIRAAGSEGGEVPPRLLREARGFVQDLRAKVEGRPLEDPADQKEALRFLAACMSLLGLLEKPDIGPALIELRKVQDTTVGNLLGFMHAYNLRFDAATTPPQKQAYQKLFAILDQTRDEILAEARLDSAATARADARAATEFLQDVDRGRPPGGATSNPPQPRRSR
jgi:hypothetical protein